VIRKLPGLCSNFDEPIAELNGLFLVRVANASYRWHPQKPFLTVCFLVLQPEARQGEKFSARIYCSQRALWRLNWFLNAFAYDRELLAREQVDERALVNLQGIVRTSATRFRGGSYQTLQGFAPASQWENVPGDQGAPITPQVDSDGF